MANRSRQNNALVDFSLSLLKIYREDITFVQIGANDGRHGDPIHPSVKRDNWRGYLFEPVPLYFNKLVENYRDVPSVQCFNMAISDTPSEMEIHYLDPAAADKVPGWATAIASFDRNHISHHVKDEYILTTKVPCLPFGDFANSHNLGEIDLFVIDVEGHEGPVCRSIDLARFRPKLIVLEHCHTPAEDLTEIRAQFRTYGLTLLEGVKDMVAVDASLLDPASLRAVLAQDEKGSAA